MFKIQLNIHLYIRDPQETELGRRLIKEAIKQIDKIGFELFTFKKLAISIDSTEASIYRYFENKNQLLSYLVAYYWIWLDLRVSFAVNNLSSAEEKLKAAFQVIVDPNPNQDGLHSPLDIMKLHQIVVHESFKAYFNKDVDEHNKAGFFLDFKKFCSKIANLMLEVNPSYDYPNAMASMLIEAAHHQVYYAEHLPRLTNLEPLQKTKSLTDFLEFVLFSTLKNNANDLR